MRTSMAALCLGGLAAALVAACSAPTAIAPVPTSTRPTASSLPSPSPAAPATVTPAPTPSPRAWLCKAETPAVYLVIDETRRHVADLETFMQLGYTVDDIQACGAAMDLPQGQPITRLLKGSGEDVFWMEAGHRRLIPDMETLTALGLDPTQIVEVPDDVLAGWPLGEPLAAPTTAPTGAPAVDTPVAAIPTAAADDLVRELVIGSTTVRLWRSKTGLTGYAVLSTPGSPDVLVENAVEVLVAPAVDLTGEGEPDVVLRTDVDTASAHCCGGTVVYNLGAAPRLVLALAEPPYQYTGSATFADLDGDGRFEALARDALTGPECSQPSVPVVLAYDPGVGAYVGASPRFPDAYADELARLTARAEASIELTRDGYVCDVYEIVVANIYLGRASLAEAELRRLYLGADVDARWEQLQALARAGAHFLEP